MKESKTKVFNNFFQRRMMMKTFEELKLLVQRFDEVCDDWFDDRYSSLLEWGGGFDSINSTKWSEGWSINFVDDFFYFEVRGETFEETITKAYDVLEGYLKQVESRNITATYLVEHDYSGTKTLHSFSIEECKKWNKLGLGRKCYPTKEEALQALQYG